METLNCALYFQVMRQENENVCILRVNRMKLVHLVHGCTIRSLEKQGKKMENSSKFYYLIYVSFTGLLRLFWKVKPTGNGAMGRKKRGSTLHALTYSSIRKSIWQWPAQKINYHLVLLRKGWPLHLHYCKVNPVTRWLLAALVFPAQMSQEKAIDS